MQDHSVMEEHPVGTGEETLPVSVYLVGVGVPAEAEPTSQAGDVRVYRDGGFLEGVGKHDVGGLPADAWQRDQFVERAWHGSTVSLDEDTAGCNEVPRLGAEQADGPDVRLYLVWSSNGEPLGTRERLEQRRGRLVDADVGCLRREHGGHQELEGIAEVELGPGVRIELA